MATKKKSTKQAAAKKTVKKKATKKKAVKKAVAKKAGKKKATKRRAAAKLSKAQSKDNLNLLIGRAITDRKFRALVVKSPAKALAQYPMLNTERDAVLEAAKNPLAAGRAIDKMIDDTIGPVGAI